VGNKNRPIAKSLLKRVERVLAAIRGPLGQKFLPLEKANATVDCLENQFTPHDLCDENHERRVETKVQALLAAVDKPPERIRPSDLQKLIDSLKLKKVCGIDCISNECLRHLPRRPMFHLKQLINNCITLSLFPQVFEGSKCDKVLLIASFRHTISHLLN
jgi:hypothetical protein